MNYEVLKDIIMSRRSIRKFKDQPVPNEVIMELIECARWAPSDTNSQPWKFIATSNKDAINKIEEATQNGITRLQAKADQMGKPEVKRKMEIFAKYALVFKCAPTVLLCLSENYKSKFTEDIFAPVDHGAELWEDEGIKCASIASQNIMLAAHAMGYGSCALSGPMIVAEEDVKRALKIEDKYRIAIMLALGTPEDGIKPAAPPRKSVEEILEIIK